MGGGCSIAYATERPQRVHRLALVAPAGLIATGAVRASWRYPAAARASPARSRGLPARSSPAQRRLKRVAFGGSSTTPTS